MFLLFIHRICFILARAVAIMGVPFAFVLIAGEAHETGIGFIWFFKLVFGVCVPIIPIVLFKYVIRVPCPRCGKKLDREVVGAGNYDCPSCGASYS